MALKGLSARIGAAALLHGVLFEKRLMSDLVQNSNGPLARLAPPDRARAQSLAGNVLRYLGKVDKVLEQFLTTSPPLKARNALRIATTEMLVDGIAPHAAVDCAVELVRGAPKTAHLAALTNAVARKVATDGAEIWKELEPQPLPSWLAKPIAKNYGKEAVKSIEIAHEKGAVLDLTFKDAARAKGFGSEVVGELLPTGSFRVRGHHQVSIMPGFEKGDWWVQDAAAAVPVRLLGDVSGKRVLDLCAAPGGKTVQLAAGRAEVTALDISSQRLERLRENLDRVRLGATLVTADALEYGPGPVFDAVLLDAPCSATGTIRRHPDLTVAKAGVDMLPLFELQSRMLDRAVSLLKSGGQLVYCTCSLLPREGERQIIDALARHGDLSVAEVDAVALGLDADWKTAEGGVRLRPDYWAERGGMDGFYMALMQKA